MNKSVTRTGTSHFINREAANNYYSASGYRGSDVAEKLASGEIHIGEPILKPGETLVIIKGEGRYMIETPASN